MSKYEIKVSYQTGDSFSSHTEQIAIEYKWSNLDVAKENLRRIKEHYQWYCLCHSWDCYRDSTREKIEAETKTAKTKAWFYDNKDLDSVLMLKTDDGKEFQYHTSWCGHFESLYWAKIDITEDDDMYFSFDSL